MTKNYSKQLFCLELRKVDWRPVLVLIDVNMVLDKLSSIFLDIVNKVAPYRDFRIKTNSQPWMCNEIMSGIRKHDKLFAQFKRDRSNTVANGILFKGT